MNANVLISPAALSAMLNTEAAVVVDTRDAANYAEAHIPGAVNIHEIFTYLATSTPEGLNALHDTFANAFGKAGLSGKETAVIYEQSMETGFGQSCRGYVLLRFLGYPRDRSRYSTAALRRGARPGCPARPRFRIRRRWRFRRTPARATFSSISPQ